MTKQVKKEISTIAKKLGKDAHKAGKKATPVLDQNLIDFISLNQHLIGSAVGSSTFVFKAWSKGWHESNLG